MYRISLTSLFLRWSGTGRLRCGRGLMHSGVATLSYEARATIYPRILQQRYLCLFRTKMTYFCASSELSILQRISYTQGWYLCHVLPSHFARLPSMFWRLRPCTSRASKINCVSLAHEMSCMPCGTTAWHTMLYKICGSYELHSSQTVGIAVLLMPCPTHCNI